MTKKQTMIIAMAGAALAASHVQAQQVLYSDQDLLLNFRTSDSQTAPNVEVDLGNISTFVSAIAALPGGMAVLDIAGATPGYTAQFSATDLLNTLGDPTDANPIGFSANAAASASSTLFLSRVISGPNATGAGLTPSGKQSATAQSATAQNIGNIGLGYNGGTQLGTGNAATVASGGTYSYYKQGVDSTGFVSYNGSQTTTSGAGGAIEGTQTGSGNLYEALWEVPPTISHSNPGTPDTYEGYFTFQPDGEVDFTVVSTPEPSTYVLFAGAGLAAFAFRRQFRSFVA